MVKAKDLSFSELKKLPSLQSLQDDLGIEFNTDLQHFARKNWIIQLYFQRMDFILLAEFVLDYYEMEFSDFTQKFERIEC